MLSKYNAANSDATSASIIVQPPLSFVRSGRIYLIDGYVYGVGEYGYYWVRTSKSSTDGYVTYSGSLGVYPLGNASRWYGNPLRCQMILQTNEEKENFKELIT